MDVGFGIKYIINKYSTVSDMQEEITHEYDTRHSDTVSSWDTPSLEEAKIHACPSGSQDDSLWSRRIQGDKHGISTTTHSEI